MAVDLNTIFGSEIKVGLQPRQADRQYVGFPGAHGVVSTHLGTRGRQLVITGTIRAATRAACQTAIDAIEPYLWADSADYTYKGGTYTNIIFDRFRLVPGYQGKFFHLTVAGQVTCQFVMHGRSLV